MLQRLSELSATPRSRVYQAAFAVMAFAGALGLRLSLDDHLPPGFPYLTFFPAVILTAFFAGVPAGVAVAVLGGLASWYFFLAPFNSFALTGFSALALGFYVFIVATEIILIHIVQLANRRLRAERERSLGLARSRELMFMELQHRVANNLQVLAALLNLQRRQVSEPAAEQALAMAAARLQVVSSIQRSLHDPDAQDVDFSVFLNRVARDVIEAAGDVDRVDYSVDAEPVVLASSQSVPLGLIVAELIANAVEHGLPAAGRMRIGIAMKRTGPGRGEISVVNDGRPLPGGFDLAIRPSLGLTIVSQFAEQLGGVFSLVGGAATGGVGTTARVTFAITPGADPGPRAMAPAPALAHA